MSEFHNQLISEFADSDYRSEYAGSFVDAWIALQIKVIREQRNLTQKQLAEALHTTQTAISRLENANYSGRTISTLKAVAKVFDCRLKVSFETYGSLIGEADKMSVDSLRRPSFDEEFPELGSVKGAEKPQKGNTRESSIAEMARGTSGQTNRKERSSSACDFLDDSVDERSKAA
jgi:transcriptional regulator with XRE-family HTH domain